MSESSTATAGRARRALTEGLVILFSILAALGVDAWWDGVNERREERALLGNVGVEFQQHRGDLQRLLGWHTDLFISTERLIEAQNGLPVTVEAMDSLLYRLYFTPSFEPGEGALAGMISSGKLELVQDERLRGMLAGWGDGVAMLDELDSTMRLFVYQSLVPLFDEHAVHVARSIATERGWPGPLPSTADAAAAHASLLTDPAFSNTVAIRREWAGAQRGEARRLLARIDSITVRIDQALDRQ